VLLGEIVLCSVKWGMHLTTFLYILFGVSILFSSTFLSGSTNLHTVSEHMGAVVYLCII